MQLTPEQKQRIAIVLCYPVTVLDNTSVNYNSTVNSRLNIDTSEFVCTRVTALLDGIDDMNLKMSNAKLAIKRIDDIEFDTNASKEYLSREKKRLMRELSSMLDIPSQCRSGAMANVYC